MKKTTITALTTLLAMNTCMAFADTNPNVPLQQNSGFYMGVSYSPGMFIITPPLNHKMHGYYASEPVAGSINLGYQFNRYVALEFRTQGYVDMFDNSGVPSLAIKGIVPVGRHVTFYGKLGVGYDYTSYNLFDFVKSHANNAGIYTDIGIGVYATKHLEFTLDHSLYYMPFAKIHNDDSPDVRLQGFASVGLTVHF